jgi:peroxiredoxin
MNKRGVLLAVVLFFFAVFLVSTALFRHQNALLSSPPHSAVKIGFLSGDLAPDFEFHSLDGGMVKLSSLRGRPVLLNFWATWCTPCRVEMPWLVALDQQYRAQGIQIIGVSLDDAGGEHQVATFARDQGVKYPVLLGDSTVANAYGGVRFMPQNFFIDRNGRIEKNTIGLTNKEDLEDGVKALVAGDDTTKPNSERTVSRKEAR